MFAPMHEKHAKCLFAHLNDTTIQLEFSTYREVKIIVLALAKYFYLWHCIFLANQSRETFSCIYY